MYLHLKSMNSWNIFLPQVFDTNKDGYLSYKEFRRAMEAQKMYCRYGIFHGTFLKYVICTFFLFVSIFQFLYVFHVCNFK